jgi:hypothetical protein
MAGSRAPHPPLQLAYLAVALWLVAADAAPAMEPLPELTVHASKPEVFEGGNRVAKSGLTWDVMSGALDWRIAPA